MKIAGLTFPMPGFSCERPSANRLLSQREIQFRNLARRIDSRRVFLASLPEASAVAEIAGMIRREISK